MVALIFIIIIFYQVTILMSKTILLMSNNNIAKRAMRTNDFLISLINCLLRKEEERLL